MFLTLFLTFTHALADAPTTPDAKPNASPDTTWFTDAGFGIFLHWGAYTQTAGRWHGLERNRDLWAEWIKNRAYIKNEDYDQMARGFNPVNFKPADWANIFKESGAKYVVLTAKHHEGFAMYHTAVNRFNSYDWPTNYHGEPVKELGDAVRSAGLKFGVYYSQQIDWHNQKGGFDNYFTTVCVPQVEELTSKYGPMGLIWFDIGLPKKEYAEQLKAIVRKNQPDALISPRIGGGVNGDYTGGGDNEVPASVKAAPWESCMTLTQHWAYYPQDTSEKNCREVIQLLADIRSKGGNMLMDVGPDDKGCPPARDVVTLRQLGLWIHKNSDAIYGVRASPLAVVPWGRVTARGDMLYLHLFNIPPRGDVLVPGIQGKIKSAWLLEDLAKTPLSIQPDGAEDYRIGLDVDNVPAEALDPDDIVVALTLEPGAKFDTEQLLDDDETNEFHPAVAHFMNGAAWSHQRVVFSLPEEPGNERARYDEMGRLVKPESALEWKFRTIHDGDYHLVLNYAWKEAIPGKFLVKVDGQTFTLDAQQTHGTPLHTFERQLVGTVAIRTSGEHVLHVESSTTSTAKDGGAIVNQLDLVPTRTTPLDASVDAQFKPIVPGVSPTSAPTTPLPKK